MNQSGGLGRWACGFFGLALTPTLFLVDTVLAQNRGWHHQSGDAIRTLMWLAGTAIVALLLISVLPRIGPIFRRYGYQLGLLGFSATVSLGLAETLVAWIHPQPSFHVRSPNSELQFEPDPIALRGISGPSTYRTNAAGFRGTDLPVNSSYRILCLGGSTTECAYLDDSETWPTLLAESLTTQWKRPVWVGSAAVSEYASGHHLRFLRESPKLTEMDSVILMPGANELMRLLFELDAGDARAPYWYSSHLLGLLREVWNVRLGHGMILDKTGEQLRIRRLGPGIDRSPTPKGQDPRSYAFRPRVIDFDTAMRDYQRRLEAIVAVAKSREIRLILVTQPVLWEDILDAYGQRKLQLARVVPYPRPWDLLTAPKLRKIMQRYNDTLIRVAASTRTEYIDAATDMNGRQEYFYDDFHLTEAGCRELAKLLASSLGAPKPAPASQ